MVKDIIAQCGAMPSVGKEWHGKQVKILVTDALGEPLKRVDDDEYRVHVAKNQGKAFVPRLSKKETEEIIERANRVVKKSKKGNKNDRKLQAANS